jgi:hypothetical protein
MARQNIAIGSAANDGTGDTLRQAGQKINETFVEIYQKFGGDSNNLSSQITIEDSAIAFEGATADAFETRLAASNVTADVLIRLPDSSGEVVVDTATQTLTNKTLTAPAISSPKVSTGINDANDNELIKVTATGSAVNEITVTNAATGNPPTVSATGGDLNVNLNLIGKGTGSVQVGKLAYSSVEITANGTASSSATYIICNKGTALAVGLDSGSTVGEFKIFTNKGAGDATITPTAFAQGTSFTVPQYSGAQTVWDGNNWYLIGNDGESDGTYIGALVDYISVPDLQSLASSADSFGSFQTLIAAL